VAEKNKKGATPQKGGGKPPQQQGKQPAKSEKTKTAFEIGSVEDMNAPHEMPRLKKKFREEIAGAMMKEFNYTNPMQVPQVKKVVVNIGVGEAIANAKALDAAVGDLAAITGQKPVINRAKNSIASFKLREGMAIGTSVTLRGDKMYEFLDRVMNISLARVRDFTGVSNKAFDGHGNYTLGLKEQIIFPEIDYDRVDKTRGMEVTIVTSANTDAEAHRLLKLMGMPFRKN
jgi:large subunit ribosomal protein L5